MSENATPAAQIDTDEYRQRTDRGKKMTLQQASEIAGVGKARLRSLVAATDSTIPSWKESPEGLGIKVMYVFEQDIRDYFSNRPARAGAKSADGTTRTPGAKSYVIKMTDEQRAALTDRFAELGITIADRYNYDPEKSKAYREQKKAKGIAEVGEQQKAQRKARKAEQQAQLELPENQDPQPDELTSQLDALLSE